jgi:predicted MFS family arabinose efflux permease
VDRWGDFGTLLTGMSLSAVGFFGLSVVTGTALVYLMIAILALGVGLATPTMASLVSQRSASDKQGAMLGSAQAAGALGQVIGPAWAGLMFVQVGPGSPFSTGAAMVLAAVLVVVFSKSRRG